MRDQQPTVAVYLEYYLTPSMTFVHRQLVGMSGGFRALVLTQETANLDLFPFDPIHVVPPSTMGRAWCRVTARASGRVPGLGPLQVRQATRILRESRARLVHAHFGPCGLQILPAAQRLRLPLVVTFHGYDASSYLRQPRYVDSLRELFASELVHVLAVSSFMAGRLVDLGAPPDRTHVQHVGIPTQEFAVMLREAPAAKQARGERVDYLQVASFVEKKGHDVLLHAFARVLRAHPCSRLTLAGDGPTREGAEESAKLLGLGDAVRFVGRVTTPEIVALTREADVFVHPSVTAPNGDEEGIPTVIMEAMATALPVVATVHAGIPELVTHGVDGLLVPERDAASLAEAMLEAVQRAPELGAAGARTVRERFDLDRQNAVQARLYRRILGEPAAA